MILSKEASSQTTGKSLAFDGVDDYPELGGDNDFGKVTNFQGSFTFEAWVLNDGSQTWQRTSRIAVILLG